MLFDVKPEVLNVAQKMMDEARKKEKEFQIQEAQKYKKQPVVVKEKVEIIDEGGNAANKLKKNIHVTKVGLGKMSKHQKDMSHMVGSEYGPGDYDKDGKKSTIRLAKKVARGTASSFDSYTPGEKHQRPIRKEEVEQTDEAVGVSNATRKNMIRGYKGDNNSFIKHTAKDKDPAEHEKFERDRHVKNAAKKSNKNKSYARDLANMHSDRIDGIEKSHSIKKALVKSKLLNKEEVDFDNDIIEIDHDEFGLGMVIPGQFTDTTVDVVFDHGIEKLNIEELDEGYHPDIEFHVVDKHGKVKGKYSTKQRARSSVDKHDNIYGAYAHSIKYYHKKDKKYVDFKDTGTKD